MGNSESFFVKNPVVSGAIAVVAFFGGFVLKGITGGIAGFVLLFLGLMIAYIAGYAAWTGYKRGKAGG